MYRHKRSRRWQRATVHRDGGVDVYATDFGQRPSPCLLHEAKWADELVGLASRRCTEQLHVRRGRAVARREDRLVSREGICGIADAVEASPVPLEHAKQARVSPRRDLLDVPCGRLVELAKQKLALFVAHNRAIEGQRMKVHIEAEGAVGALHERERAYLGIADRTQAKLSFRAPTQRALQRFGERAEHVRAQLAIVAQGAAKSPRERADPLTDRNLWEDEVHQVRGDIRHTSTQARRTKAATLAGETHDHLVATSAARELDEAVLQNPASQVRVELFLDELRQTALGFGALAESRPVLAHQRMQERVFRTPRRVAIAARLLGARRSRRLRHLNLHRRK
jgi:hypothetical protein